MFNDLFNTALDEALKMNNDNDLLSQVGIGNKTKIVNRHDVNNVKWVTETDIVKHVENHAYKLINIPDASAKRSAYELHPTTGGPVKTPFGYEASMGRFPIAWMIESYTKQIPFEFEYWQDCCEAATYLEKYTRQLSSDLDRFKSEITTPELADQYDRVELFVHMTTEFCHYLVPLARRLNSYHNRTDEQKDTQFIKNFEKIANIPSAGLFKDELENIKYLKPMADRIRRTRPK